MSNITIHVDESDLGFRIEATVRKREISYHIDGGGNVLTHLEAHQLSAAIARCARAAMAVHNKVHGDYYK
jgi:hypothetical protein